MDYFKYGDRVSVTGHYDDRDFFNNEGTIIVLDSHNICVAFDNWHEGHEIEFDDRREPGYSDGYIIQDNCWFVPKSLVALLENSPVEPMHPDNEKYLKIVRKIKQLDRKFKQRKDDHALDF